VETRQALEALLRTGWGRRWPVAFDFDNTIIAGDVGEATLALLVRDRLLRAETLPETLAPRFLSQGRPVSPQLAEDLTEYYEAFLTPTAHGACDPFPLANGYVWAVEAMQGLTVAQVVRGTQSVLALAKPGEHADVVVRPGGAAYPVPVLYAEMVELLARLLAGEFAVWIVSASNVWSVRWMVQHALNPALREHGIRGGLAADRVIGVSTLLMDERGQLFKDAVLVKRDAAYAGLDPARLAGLRLTSRLQFPVPVYSGKVACLWDVLGRRPLLAAGDSPGDLPMLAFARHRLWLARQNKPRYEEARTKAAAQTGNRRWLVQATVGGDLPGFRPGQV